MTLPRKLLEIMTNLSPANAGRDSNERVAERRVIYVLAHAFELTLISAIGVVSYVLGVPLEKVFQHCCESIATISLVHCVDTVRIMSERISKFAEFQWAATNLGKTALAKNYRDLLENAKLDRSWFTVFTVLNTFLWFCVSLLFAAYMATSTGGVQVPIKMPHYVMHWGVGIFSGLSLMIAGMKVWHASAHPEELTMEFLLASNSNVETLDLDLNPVTLQVSERTVSGTLTNGG